MNFSIVFLSKDADGNLIFDPEPAETIKRIYSEYLYGYSMDKIVAGLMADGILTGAKETKWWTSTINKILRNELFRRIHWNNRDCKSIVWSCESRLQNTGVPCRVRTVNEELLQKIIVFEDHFTVELKSGVSVNIEG